MSRNRVAQFVGNGALVLIVILLKAFVFPATDPESDFDMSLMITEGVLITVCLPVLGFLEVRLERAMYSENWQKYRVAVGTIAGVLLLIVGIVGLIGFFRTDAPTAREGLYALLGLPLSWTTLLTFRELQQGESGGEGEEGEGPFPDHNPPECPGSMPFNK